MAISRFAERVKHIAKTAHSPEEAVDELNKALVLTAIAVALAVAGPKTSVDDIGPDAYSVMKFLSFIIGALGFGWFS